MDENHKNVNEHLYQWEKTLLDRPLNLDGWDEFEKESLENWKVPKDFLK
ncbi:MAG: hypothetical protein L3J20_10500 [Flavobacteriaceae bacterium]|nr:hypothetical protein [Flavobacteriaceae bacterium]